MRTRIIAEAGVNHDGNEADAIALIDAAADAGADVVKFQTFDPKALVAADAPQARYQARNTGRSESQQAMLERLALSPAAHVHLQAHCEARGIDFLSTPFDLPSLALLVESLHLHELKISSGDLTNAPLLLRAAQSGARLILSTGMASLDEVREALGVVAFALYASPERPQRAAFARAYAAAFGDAMAPAHPDALVQSRVTLLHCTSAYPAAPASINLRAMDALTAAFGLPVGLSDHSAGITIPIAAAARGATVIEKHLTLDPTRSGPDHAASLDPATFATMVRAIRETEAALGDGQKTMHTVETDVRTVARKSLFAAAPLRAGERFDEATLTTRRPGTGVSAMEYFDWLGDVAATDLLADTMLTPDARRRRTP